MVAGAWIVVSGCKATPLVSLAWAPPDQAIAYAAYLHDNQGLGPLTPRSPEWAAALRSAREGPGADRDLRSHVALAGRLRELELPRWPDAELRISGLDGERLIVEGIHADPGPSPDPGANAADRDDYALLKALAGEQWLWGVIDRSGALESFYLPEAQKVGLSLLFRLPDGPVRIGDSWDVPLQLVQLDARFSSRVTSSFSRATLLAMDTVGGARRAMILYLSQQSTEGVLEGTPGGATRPFQVAAYAAGCAIVDVESGVIEEYTGQLVYEGSGGVRIDGSKVLALRSR